VEGPAELERRVEQRAHAHDKNGDRVGNASHERIVPKLGCHSVSERFGRRALGRRVEAKLERDIECACIDCPRGSYGERERECDFLQQVGENRADADKKASEIS
jgi:hypothetical protein